MRICTSSICLIGLAALGLSLVADAAIAFEGRIHATQTQGTASLPLLYTVSAEQMLIETSDAAASRCRNVIDRKTGAVTLLFPHNRSFMRLPSIAPADSSSARENISPVVEPTPASRAKIPGDFPAPPEMRMPPPDGNRIPAMPARPDGLPPGIGPQPGASGPMMPIPPAGSDRVELKPTGEVTNFFGLRCRRYEWKGRGDTLEIWATGELVPFQSYLENPPHRFGVRPVEQQWPELLAARKLFPLLVSIRTTAGSERFRFEVKSVLPEPIAARELFGIPEGYQPIEPLAF